MLSAATLSQVQSALPSSKYGSLYAIDLETSGTDASSPLAGVVGIGFANEDGCFYIDLRGIEVAAFSYLVEFLQNVKLTAFNVLFDGAFLAALTGRWLDWVGCSYALFKQLSSEGYDGQSWRLEVAQLDVLGWSVSNKTLLEDILKERGVSKADMGTLEPEVLGPYCASDADAAWQLWHHLLTVIAEHDFKFLMEYHEREFMTEVRLLAESQFLGIQTDLDGLKSYHRDLSGRIDTALNSFLTHQDVAHHIGAYNTAVTGAIDGAAPPRLTAKGVETERWKKWPERRERLIQAQCFNPNSTQQLAWLFYEKIHRVVKERADQVTIAVNGKEYEVEKTDGGQRSVKKQLLPLFGEPGNLLRDYNKLAKEASYVEAAIAKAEPRGGVIHATFNSVGTVTGRLSAGVQSDD